MRHAELAGVERVVELGCGTGRLALRLLSRELPPHVRYLGLDVSETMVTLATARLAAYPERAEVRLAEGPVALPVPDHSADRVVSTYVMDLLSEEDVARFVEEAERALDPEGRLCLVGLTHGRSPVARVVSTLWSAVHALRPRWVGGCRPASLAPLLERRGWSLPHSAIVQAWGIASEVVVAVPPRAGAQASETA